MKLQTISDFLKHLVLLILLVCSTSLMAADEPIDATDPTKIYTFAGGGLKFNDYTNGETMWEARVIGNIGFSERDMLLFEAGYGWHDGTQAPGNDSGLTNARFRWFHMFDMNYDLETGYRGMGFQMDTQLAGALKGTDGQNQVLVGVMPVYALSHGWNLYLMLNIANTWDKGWDYWNGVGPSVSTQFIYDNEDWWPGAQVRLTPTYTYFIAGELENEGSGTFELNIGGAITPTVMWDITAEKNFDVDLRTYKREPSDKLENDWNFFFNVTSYF